MKQITILPAALKTLRKMPANTAKLIRGKIKQYAVDPANLANNVIALKGEKGLFRLRVGDWRIIFTEDGQVIEIVRIAPRGGAYE